MASLVFIPPTVADVPRTVPWAHPANSLFRYYRPYDRGVTVFLLADGSFTEIQPPDDEGVVHTYHGGHEHPVTEAEAAALTAAGYGDRIITQPDPTVQNPAFAAPPSDVNPGGYTPQGSEYN